MWRHMGPLTTWTLLYTLNIITFIVICFFYAKRVGVKGQFWIVLSAGYVLGMIVVAKFLYDVQHGQLSFVALLRPGHYLSGGLWGGVLGYLVLGVPLALMFGRPKAGALDLVAVPLPLPLMLTKVGCLCNGCCYGTPTSMPWAVTFPPGAAEAPPGIPIHPTQTYEVAALAGALGLFALLGGERWRGTMLWWFLIAYGLGRALSEIWRADLAERGYVVGGLSSSQIACLLAVTVSLLALWRGRGRKSVEPVKDGSFGERGASDTSPVTSSQRRG